MAEILGVVAAATQLGAACLGLLDLVKSIKGGTTTLKRHQEELQELHHLSTIISHNPLLQTIEIGIQTQSLLQIIEKGCLGSLLQKGRFQRTWVLMTKDQELGNTLSALERQKSSLSLVIHNIQAKALYQIQSDIRNMSSSSSENTGRTSHTNESTRANVDLVSAEKPVTRLQQAEDFVNGCLVAVGPAVASVKQDGSVLQPIDFDRYYTFIQAKRSRERTTLEEVKRQEEMKQAIAPGVTYYNCTAGDGISSSNSVQVEGDQAMKIASRVLHLFNGNESFGSGDHDNTTSVTVDKEDSECPENNKLRVRFDSCHANGGPSLVKPHSVLLNQVVYKSTRNTSEDFQKFQTKDAWVESEQVKVPVIPSRGDKSTETTNASADQGGS